MTDSLDTFTFAPGFHAAAVACGLKTSSVMEASNLDLALVAAERPCSAAGVFTTNRVKAAPVLYDQQVLATNAGSIRAVITNAGNANAVTGPRGMDDTRRMAACTAEALGCRPDQVLVLSTGVIGRHLDMDKVTRGIAEITSPAARQGAPYVARAIMTTDTRPKIASGQIAVGGRAITIGGCCKGAGMIHPNMATLLAIVTTDALVAPELLQVALQAAAARSFNRISVDGDMSTNDTLLLLASGASGVPVDQASLPAFTAELERVCVDLARQVARDGEGATRLIEIRVVGADSEAQAHMVADSIACSPLVKTAVHGGDPNWGRVLCAAGYSGAAIDVDRLSLTFGPADRPSDKYDSPAVQVVANGLPTVYDEQAARAALVCDPVLITLDLGLGDAGAIVWTCDLTAEYVAINAHYTT
jgi:glutamate N-acetyltransferase / amino-acid N-acetyltransferase